MAGALIERIDLGNAQFRRQLKKLDPARLGEFTERITMLPRQALLPDKLPVHQAIGREEASALDHSKKVPAWTMHATNDD